MRDQGMDGQGEGDTAGESRTKGLELNTWSVACRFGRMWWQCKES